MSGLFQKQEFNCDSGATVEQETQADEGLPLSREAAVALVRQIQNGDKSALATLYDGTSRLLFGLVLRVLGDRALAEETLLEVYTHVWKQAASYDPRVPPLEWLTTIAHARAVARLHWDKPGRGKPERSSGSPGPMTVAPEQQKLARASLESLVPTQQEILDWAYYSGLSSSEIAAQVGKPLGAVKTHARLGLSKLSELFRPLYE
jgi:RNA polymerase sigma-70 factor (ECF subfamily)